MDLNGLELVEFRAEDIETKVNELFTRPYLTPDEKIDLAELYILTQMAGHIQNFDEESPQCKLTHRFTPNLYIREIFMPAGTTLTTKIHKLEHPFVVSQGLVSVYSGIDGPQLICAPYCGITKADTRRFLVVHEDTIWTTFHLNPTEERNLTMLGRQLCEHRNNPLLQPSMKHTEFQVSLPNGEIR